VGLVEEEAGKSRESSAEAERMMHEGQQLFFGCHLSNRIVVI
jgi:hypothetical protein